MFYGARQRKAQVSAILPLIEGEKINIVESQKKTLVVYLAGTIILLLCVIVLAVIIFMQVKKLQLAKHKLTEAHVKELTVNHELADTNNRLSEANKIKEEYLGYIFSSNADFFTRIERFKKSIEQKVADRKLDEVKFLVNNINIKREKDDLLKNFDKIFLKLFPNFIDAFNTLFKNEDHFKVKDNELLNTDLRIFALIRMGIHDNEKIAEVLEYSVHTINTYKTKIKNKSIVPNEEFEQRIMQIRSI
jgi:MFS superfamily sulfate permease-like transporter